MYINLSATAHRPLAANACLQRSPLVSGLVERHLPLPSLMWSMFQPGNRTATSDPCLCSRIAQEGGQGQVGHDLVLCRSPCRFPHLARCLHRFRRWPHSVALASVAFRTMPLKTFVRILLLSCTGRLVNRVCFESADNSRGLYAIMLAGIITERSSVIGCLLRSRRRPVMSIIAV